MNTQVLTFLMLFMIGMESITTAEFLKVNRTGFYYGEDKVFLSGVNFAWKNYAFDFGNKNYEKSAPFFEKWITEVANAGGNSLRVWIHIEGQNTPDFDSSGFPKGLDREGTLLSDLSKFLDFAKNHNLFVILVLWNGAVGIKDNYRGLIMDDRKLDAYIKKALKPMVQGLKFKPALGAWEIMNEPEGSTKVASDSNPCYDTGKFKDFGLDWTQSDIPMSRILRFVNKLAAAIKKEDPKALVTLGSWSHLSQTDAYENSFNHYKDECLTQAGGESTGTIDFYQMHAYSWEGHWSPEGPFKVTSDSYMLDKPVVIGEFSSACSMEEGVEVLWDYGYEKGYAGIWSWMYSATGNCTDSQEDQIQGIQWIRHYTSNGKISVKIRLLDSIAKNGSKRRLISRDGFGVYGVI